MKLLLTILLISTILGSFPLEAQTGKNRFKEVTVTNKDQKTYKASIDVDQFFQKGRLITSDSAFGKSALGAIYSIQLDSSVYLLKSIRNKNDSIAVLSRAIEGKVSVLTPPLESGIEALFVEKDETTYEMRQKEIESNGRRFYQNEYRGFLKVFFSDCYHITKEMIDKVPFSETRIMEIVSKYNRACGFEKANVAKKYKSKFQAGLQVEGIFYNSTKGAYNNYFDGDRPTSGYGVGLFVRLDFARKKSAFIISELTYSSLSGGGNIQYYVTVPTYQVFTEHNEFDIKEIRNTYSAYFNIARFNKSTLSAGGGVLLLYQLQNKSTTGVTTPRSSVKPEDKFGFSPVVSVLFNVNRFGLGYQVAPLAIQLTGVEGYHIEHKFFLQVSLAKR